MRMAICTMPGCQTSAGCKCSPPGYLAPFTPSPADQWYGKELEALNAEIERLRTENEELKAALREDAERMKADQDAIDGLRLSLSEARATGRREGMEEAARIAEGNYDHIGVQSVRDKCTHGRSSCEDCDQCAAAAIRAAMEKAE